MPKKPHKSNPYEIERPGVVQFSGGRTSGYLLKHIIDAYGGKLPEDIIVCFQNTGLEHEKTLEFIRDCELNWGVEIHWIEYDVRENKNNPTGTEYFPKKVTFDTAARKGEPFKKMVIKQGYLPNPLVRSCTANLKIRVAQKYLRQFDSHKDGWVSALGLRFDEPHRVHRVKPDSRFDEPMCPLYYAEVTEQMVLDFWNDQPFDLNLPLGGNIAGNCVGCFLKGKPKIETLMKEMPEQFDVWVELENIKLGKTKESASYQSFRTDRPRYEDMLATSKSQGWLFTPEEMAIDDSKPCFCHD